MCRLHTGLSLSAPVASSLLGYKDDTGADFDAEKFYIGFLAVAGASLCSGISSGLSQVALQV